MSFLQCFIRIFFIYLSPMLFGLCSVQRHEINTLKVTWPRIGFLSSVTYHYRIFIVVSSCAHFPSFSNKVSICSPSDHRVQLVILSASAVLDARRGMCVCVCVCLTKLRVICQFISVMDLYFLSCKRQCKPVASITEIR